MRVNWSWPVPEAKKYSFQDRPLLILDLETTGLDPAIHDVLEIGAVLCHQRTSAIQSTFQVKIEPWRLELAQPKALEVNGYTPERWQFAVRRREAWTSFFDFGRNAIMSSWNAHFELGFIQPPIHSYFPHNNDDDLKRFGPFDRHLIDLPSIAWAVLGPQAKLGKDYIAAALGLPPEPKPHGALTGALHASSILKALRFHIGLETGHVQEAA